MSVAIFLVTHEGVGQRLLDTATAIVNRTADNIGLFELPMDSSPAQRIDQAQQAVLQLDLSDGLILLTDLFGASPSNLARQLAQRHQAPLLSGVNLPMLVRLFNYRDAPLQSLTRKILEGGKMGICQTD